MNTNSRSRFSRRIVAIGAVVAALAVGAPMYTALADGTETLGPPSIPIASGTGVAVGGIGMITQPGALAIDIPAGATVAQVLLYWEGHSTTENAGSDDTIVINGASVTGTTIGGPTLFFSGAWSTTFRADITGLDLVAPGPNSLTLSGLDFDRRSNGAGIMAIYDDGGTAAEIEVFDGNDLAYFDFAPTLDTTVPQTFTFVSAPIERLVSFSMFASSVHDQPNVPRPNVISVIVNGIETRYSDLLDSNDGDEWDTVAIDVTVPAGADSITVQALSADDNATGNQPASFAWLAAAAVVPPYVPPTTTTTTTTTTTVPDPTTTTTVPDPTTTTTVPDPTTTTVADPTTTVPDPTTTTTLVDSGSPTTTVAQELPETGIESTNSMLALGTALLLIGGGIIAASRRRYDTG